MSKYGVCPLRESCESPQPSRIFFNNVLGSTLVSPVATVLQNMIVASGKLSLQQKLHYPMLWRQLRQSQSIFAGMGAFTLRNVVSSTIAFCAMEPISELCARVTGRSNIAKGLGIGCSIGFVETVVTGPIELRELAKMSGRQLTHSHRSFAVKAMGLRNMAGWSIGGCLERSAQSMELSPGLSASVGGLSGVVAACATMCIQSSMVRGIHNPTPPSSIITAVVTQVVENPQQAFRGVGARGAMLGLYFGVGTMANRCG